MNSELAPTEDQGVIFGIIDAPANATIDQTAAFADAAEKEFLSFPETNFTFQLTFPSSGFGGMVFKPWGQRKETPFQLLPKVQAKAQHDSRHPDVSVDAPCPARRRTIPG